MVCNKYYVIVSSLLYVASSYSLHKLSDEDNDDALDRQTDPQLFTLKQHMQHRNISVHKDGNYLIAIQELQNNVKEQHVPEDMFTMDTSKTQQSSRQKRNIDYKNRFKLKGYSQNDFNSVLKKSDYWSTSKEAKAVVDLLVLVDNSAYQQTLLKNNYDSAKTIKYLETYYRLLVSLINTRYGELKTREYSINIRPADIMILKDTRSSRWVEQLTRSWRNENGEWEKVVDPEELLDQSHQWILKNVNSLPQHDHVMTFVGYRMVRRGRNSPSSGMAYVNTICQTKEGYSCSVIQETWGFGNAGAATHELGHSLGAAHDGLKENEDCLAEQGYIMAPSSSPQDNYELNFFSFSPCSIRAFKKTVLSEQAACLYDSRAEGSSGKLPGDLLTPEAQCREVFGQESGQCLIRNVQEPEEICERLWCARPIGGDRVSCSTRGGLHAVYGTPCARNKICYNGQCLHENLIPRQANIEEDLLSSAEENLDNFQQHDERYENIRNRQNVRERIQNVNKERSGDNLLEKQTNIHESRSPIGRVIAPSNTHRDGNSEETSVSDKLSSRHRNRKPNRGRTRPLSHLPITTTKLPTTTTTTTTTEAPSCVSDVDQYYCRSTVYMHPAACDHAQIRDYCCYSCSYMG